MTRHSPAPLRGAAAPGKQLSGTVSVKYRSLVMAALILPTAIQRRAEAAAGRFLRLDSAAEIDFAEPRGEEALVAADSVSWKVFKNPVALFIGGVAAVILELAEPRVRAGVWEHTTFRTHPLTRLQRTGLAAMVTVYAARSKAERMIADVNRRHTLVTGVSDDGRTYAANDPELLDWVQATALYGFGEAYHRFVQPLSPAERDRLWAESATSARLYGATGAPALQAQWEAQLGVMTPRLTASPIICEFLDIMRRVPLAPWPSHPVQLLLIRAAASLTPPDLARTLDLERRLELAPWEVAAVRTFARGADRLLLTNAPPVQACRRLGLPADWLYQG